jgi:hypothetical protein
MFNCVRFSFACLVVFVDVVDTEYNDSVTVQFLPTSDYNPFRIITSPGGGRVILEQSLANDRDLYNLTLQASDRLGHTSQAQLLITIYDVNDHTVCIVLFDSHTRTNEFVVDFLATYRTV